MFCRIVKLLAQIVNVLVGPSDKFSNLPTPTPPLFFFLFKFYRNHLVLSPTSTPTAFFVAKFLLLNG